MPISCVNGIDRDYPDYVDYSIVRTPNAGVPFELNDDFLCGCDCTDNCAVSVELESILVAINSRAFLSSNNVMVTHCPCKLCSFRIHRTEASVPACS